MQPQPQPQPQAAGLTARKSHHEKMWDKAERTAQEGDLHDTKLVLNTIESKTSTHTCKNWQCTF
jgi:hypothetical protein